MTTLRDLLLDSRDGEWGKGEPFAGGHQVSVIRGTDFAATRIGVIEKVPVRVLDEKHLRRKALQAGDIIIETAGGTKDQPTGRTLYVSERLLRSLPYPAVCASFARFLRIDQAKALPRFVFWLLQDLYERREILQYHLQHTGVARFQFTTFADTHELVLPDYDIQRRIAGILSAYDDLIDVNQRRIAILEEMARRLFDEWFVRFRYPGHEHVKIVDGLPEGWDRRALGEVAEIRLGKMLDAKKNRGELRPYLANVNVRWGAFDLTDLREMRVEENELTKYGLSFGDIVMCEGGEPGRCALWKAQVPEMTIQKALHRIRALDGLDPLFLYHQLFSMAKTRQLDGLFTGATIKHLPKEKLIEAMIAVPPPKLIREFTALAAPLEAQIGTLGEAISRAAQARDLLLPKLISGEIDVGRAEEALARAAE